MIRFFLSPFAIIFFVFVANAETSSWPEFKNHHITPFIKKGTDSTSAWIWVAGGLSITVSLEDDDRVRNFWHGHQQMNTSLSRVGDLMGTGGFSLIAAGLQYKFDDREHVYQSHLRGFIYGGMSIYALKTLFGRKRPGTSRNYQSFPSGHTTIMFMSASHLWHAYGWPVGVASGALAAMTAASRLSDDAHWYSDVVAGAFLGVWVGRASFYEFNPKTTNEIQSSKRLHYFPIVSDSNIGFGIHANY